ncbi:MAG: M23 family metallopeptidase [Bacteroidales bacterium]|nr:M23 family metallopeptidase [Bacteroidales bacterium]
MGRQNKIKRYRLMVTNDESHEKVYSFRVTRVGFLVAVILCLCSLVGGIYALVIFTPLRHTVPGYPDANFRRQAIQNAIKIDSLETAMTRWQMYSENLSRVLGGEQTLVLDSIVNNNSTRYLQRENEKYLKTRDSLLRAKVNKEEAFGVSSGAQRHLPIEGVHFFTPLKGVISNGYDIASHPAVDITAPKNSVIKSVLDGSVVAAGWSDEYGYTITIQHEGDILSTYKHNSKLLKKQGDKVTAGTPIAQVGNTGSLTTGAHLHFELWYKGEAIDPTKYISF